MSALLPATAYRYGLERVLDPMGLARNDLALFLMLNPSVAKMVAESNRDNDPTVRKCMGFCQRWGFRRFRIVNLFAMTATYWKDLVSAHGQGFDVVGPDNDQHIVTEARAAQLIVCAWGARGEKFLTTRVTAVLGLLWTETHHSELHCIARTGEGHPQHPLMAKYVDTPAVWRRRSLVEGSPTS